MKNSMQRKGRPMRTIVDAVLGVLAGVVAMSGFYAPEVSIMLAA